MSLRQIRDLPPHEKDVRLLHCRGRPRHSTLFALPTPAPCRRGDPRQHPRNPRLERGLGGPPVFPALPAGLDREQRVQSINTWETSPERDARRRSIYVFQRRSLSLAMLEVFDAPVLNASCDLRRNTVTALQPLAMYNSEFVNTEARYFAERVSRGAGTETARQIQRAYLIARGREADASELAQAARFLRGIPMPMMH